MSKRTVFSIIGVFILLLVGWSYRSSTPPDKGTDGSRSSHGRGGSTGGSGSVPVVAGKAEQKDVPIYLDGLGTVQAFNTDQDIRVGGRSSKAQYQYALVDQNIEELNSWAPKLVKKLHDYPQIKDATSDQQFRGLQETVVIDRDAAARLEFNRRRLIAPFIAPSGSDKFPSFIRSKINIMLSSRLIPSFTSIRARSTKFTSNQIPETRYPSVRSRISNWITRRYRSVTRANSLV